MPHKLYITEEAQQDTHNAVDYYTTISESLADRFEQELYHAYTKIGANPQSYKYLTKGKKKKYRCAALKSFSYIVIYRIEEQLIVIIAVFHTRRKPVYGFP